MSRRGTRDSEATVFMEQGLSAAGRNPPPQSSSEKRGGIFGPKRVWTDLFFFPGKLIFAAEVELDGLRR